MLVVLAWCAALSAVAELAVPELTQGGCPGRGDDSFDDTYMSLLQDSVSLLKHGSRAQEARDAYDSSVGHGSSATIEANVAMFGFVSIVAIAAAAYYFLVLPARAPHVAFFSSQPGNSAHGSSMLEYLMVNHDNQDEVDIRTYDSFDEDTYSLAIALIVRDLHTLASGKIRNRGLRYARLAFSVGLIALTIFLQVAILVGTKMYVTPQQVASIRDSYDQYEVAMYNHHTYLNKNGKHRGVPGHFNVSAFGDLDGDLQEAVCNIPLSQLTFIGLVLLVWAITCTAQLKKCIESFMAVVFLAETKDTMAEALTDEDEEDDDEDAGGSDINDGIPVKVITGLTLQVKAMLTAFVFLPDFAATSYVLWLGSRWLVATNDFGNVISNAVALEFILMLKCLLFYALVSERNKRDLAHTGLAPSWSEEPAGYGIYFNTTIWVFIAIAWVYFYINHQQVLPDYKWDVHAACSPWLANQLNPDAG